MSKLCSCMQYSGGVFTNACSTLEAYSPMHAVHWRRIHQCTAWRRIHQCMQYTGGVFTNACSTLEAYSPMHAVHRRHIHQCMQYMKAYSPMHAVHWRCIHQCVQYTGGGEGLGMRLHCKNMLVVLTTEWLPWLQTTGETVVVRGLL